MQYELPLKIVSYEVRRAYIVILTGFVFLFFLIITGTVCFISTCMLIKLVTAFFFFLRH